MRGKGDEASPTLQAPDLEDIISAQEALLLSNLNSNATADIPKTWVLYKV
jgi:hypothetical protein